MGRKWRERLLAFLPNPYAVAGIMGNMMAESGLRSNNLQGSKEKALGMTDEQYTAAVDDGSYTNFVHDGAGYGLFQATYWS
ncbi:MAG: N-acetylmuramoyl-L-alanine amidase, partial [Clostridia bacterium]|nr:N-acetylmuramoyl-L-alanine amidase [Clostridia bacterium]